MNHRTWRLLGSLWCSAAIACGVMSCSDAQRGDPLPVPAAAAAATTSRNTVTRGGELSVGSWNIEWFGDPTNGPGNEPLQLANAAAVLAEVDADLWGFAEIVDEAQWTRLVASMRGYSGLLASDRTVEDGRRHYAAREQKVAVLYRSDAFTVRHARVILASNDADFAGRPPLEVRLRRTDAGGAELVFIVVHLKARADDGSWRRRERAARALKAYLDRTHPDAAVIVAGDWNDGVDRSITVGRPSPFAEFVRDPAHYRFTSRGLTNRSARSGSGTLVDHHLVTNELAALELPGTAAIVSPSVRNYRNTTSDHFPVVSHFRSLPP